MPQSYQHGTQFRRLLDFNYTLNACAAYQDGVYAAEDWHGFHLAMCRSDDVGALRECPVACRVTMLATGLADGCADVTSYYARKCPRPTPAKAVQ